jgi:hypothetical protein
MPAKPNARKLWSPADMARLSGLVEAGYSIPQIAIDLGRSQEAVRMKAHQTDLMPKRARRSSSRG